MTTVPLLVDLHESLMYFDINQIEKINGLTFMRNTYSTLHKSTKSSF